jgi:hypothetical protein
MNNYVNPYWPNTSILQKQEVVQVSGRNGAEMYQMGPNSSALLLDSTAPIVWLKVTDGAGYPTITAYDIALHQEPKQVDLSALEERLMKLEEKVNEQSKSNIDSASGPKTTIIKQPITK